MNDSRTDIETVALLAAAVVCWFVLFSPWTAPRIPFWPGLVAATGLLAGASLLIAKREGASHFAFRGAHLAIGVATAAILYLIFLAGGEIARRILPFAGAEIGRVYVRGEGVPPAVIALALLWIAPAEELFWRGFVQRRCVNRWGNARGLLLAAILYAAVHLWAGNLMLGLAALVCGLFWGAIYLRYGSLWPGILSHAIWDLTVFLVLPFA